CNNRMYNYITTKNLYNNNVFLFLKRKIKNRFTNGRSFPNAIYSLIYQDQKMFTVTNVLHILAHKTRFKHAFSCWTIISCASILRFSLSRKAAFICVCISRAFLASLDFFAEALFFLLRS
ncbi:hypothetical protein ACROYT_G034916, partial [Oculina patagonica]